MIENINPDKHTQTELLDKASELDIFAFPQANNPSRPTKSEIAEAINRANASGRKASDSVDRMNGGIAGDDVSNTPFKQLPKNVRRRIQEDVLNMRRRVFISVNSKAATQTVQDEVSDDTEEYREFKWMTWGNDLIGHKRSKVVFDTDWHIPHGLLLNLEDAVGYVYKKVGSGYETIPVKKYSIKILPPLTEDEINDIAKLQRYQRSLTPTGRI